MKSDESDKRGQWKQKRGIKPYSPEKKKSGHCELFESGPENDRDGTVRKKKTKKKKHETPRSLPSSLFHFLAPLFRRIDWDGAERIFTD